MKVVDEAAISHCTERNHTKVQIPPKGSDFLINAITIALTPLSSLERLTDADFDVLETFTVHYFISLRVETPFWAFRSGTHSVDTVWNADCCLLLSLK